MCSRAACISVDNPRYLSFIPAAPTEAATLFDLVVGASSIYGGSWLEGAGAVYAENQALRWIADLAGLPERLAACSCRAARSATSRRSWPPATAADATRRRAAPIGGCVACSRRGALVDAARGARHGHRHPAQCPSTTTGRMTGDALRRRSTRTASDDVFAVVATGGTTNYGIVDDLARCRRRVSASMALWMHVDGAYGGAALCAPSVRHLFDGIEHADSFIVDPHKWLFAPVRRVRAALPRPRARPRGAHPARRLPRRDQHGGEWNPSDYAIHLSRARAACRSGSRWPRTARRPTPRRSSRR